MEEAAHVMNVGTGAAGLACLAVFAVSYLLILAEETIHLKKSKPVMLGASLIWLIIALAAPSYNVEQKHVEEAILHGLTEYAGLLLFLLSAMTYISALQERNVFEVLQGRLSAAGYSYRALFWVTGIIAFFLSPFADNLTTALVMGAVVVALGRDNPRFISVSCVNIVVAANAGGASSPFGDITTLMVWQAGKVDFFEFFALFIPSVVNFLIPAAVMSFFISSGAPAPRNEAVSMKRGAKTIIFLGALTIAMAVGFKSLLGLPPFMGMMTGLALLMAVSWHIRYGRAQNDRSFDIMRNISSVEWDTLLFFFGIIFSIGGLAFLGYLEYASSYLYGNMDPGHVGIGLGLASAIIDNIPVMYAVLSMNPPLDHFQWLLITLTTGVGGSLLSVGSAAGVALMGASGGRYTFFSHIRWTPAIALGYAASIWAHYLMNG